MNHTVFIGDCLDAMREIPDASVDLIATDPPFNKEKRFDHNFGSPKGYKPGFDDKWDGWLMTPQRAEELTLLEKCHPKLHRLCAAALEMHSAGMQGYLVMMAVRLIECHRLLKETGSIYLHCDHSANAYLRLLMDGIFGEKNFRREVIWALQRPSGFKTQTQNWIRGHDTILFYVKNAGMQTFNKQYEPYPEKYIKKHFKKSDELGPYWLRDGRKRRLGQGFALHDVWSDIHSMQTQSVSRKEATGWRTQKPLALYSRMILASSNPGDVVLDPFCGCATTLVAAENAGRQWIGIDRDECAGEMVVQQLTKLNEGTEDWLRKVIVRDDIPERTDAGKIPHYIWNAWSGQRQGRHGNGKTFIVEVKSA